MLDDSKEEEYKLFLICFKQIMKIIVRNKVCVDKVFLGPMFLAQPRYLGLLPLKEKP